ncbi:hypothetical protein PanWU01x14_316430 [Parasponia andersonii]|uniref:Uncharacterized protein n=1 Tax=Parasponia andersonii TaxID=3476 RepID=A0A2P5AMY8_PARAD|nr:hypothetical protein PanWU01x14_316430 [Parasponia andersonii]
MGTYLIESHSVGLEGAVIAKLWHHRAKKWHRSATAWILTHIWHRGTNFCCWGAKLLVAPQNGTRTSTPRNIATFGAGVPILVLGYQVSICGAPKWCQNAKLSS